jgi:hypothetical protein
MDLTNISRRYWGYRAKMSYSGQPAACYRCGDTEHMSKHSQRRIAQQTTMHLNERPMWGQLVEAAPQATDIKETAHARSGTTATITGCGLNSLPDQQQSDGVNMSARAVTVPTAIANRTPTSASREAGTQVKRHDGVDEQAQGPISTSVVQRRDVTVSGRTGGRDCNDGAGQPREDKDYDTR